jgi:hypothetical protein
MVSMAIGTFVRPLWLILPLFVVWSVAPVAAQAPTLAGTWRMTQVTATEDFFILMDFSEGGAARYTDQGLSSGVGVWAKTSGSNFSATFEEFVDFDDDGSADARLRFRATIQLAGANDLVGTLTADLVTVDGSTVQNEAIGHATLVGTRMVVIPE